MKISKIINNFRKKEFRLTAGSRSYTFPYAKLRLVPTQENPVVQIYPDPEVGEEAFTYRLKSGEEDTVHLDAVLDVNVDPGYLQDLFLHQLTIEARRGLSESGLGIRQIARQLGTSPTQLYRLLDPANGGKSVGQMLALLNLVDCEVELVVNRRSDEPAVADSFQVLDHLTDSGIDNIRAQITELMRRRGVVRAGVFGSVARCDATDSSDVDFLVEFEEGRSLLDLAGLRLDLADVLNRNVDVATPESLHPEMRKRVLDELVPLL